MEANHRNRDLRACAFLVGLRFPDMDYETVGDPLDVGHLEGGDLGAPQRRREADQQQRAISPADQGVRNVLEHGGDRALWPGPSAPGRHQRGAGRRAFTSGMYVLAAKLWV
jgi:hypothetical protein